MNVQRNFLVFAYLVVEIFALSVPIDQTLFATPGTLYTLPNSSLQLGTVDPTSGKIAIIGPAYPTLIISEQLTALDYVNQFLYSVALDLNNNSVYLVAMDLTSGNIKNQITLPFAESFFVGAGQGLDVDPITGDVFVFGREAETGPHTLLRVSPTNKSFQTIITFDGIDVLGGVSAYDPIYKIFWIETASNTSLLYFGIDVLKGVLAWNLNDDLTLETLAWDPASKLMYGFGLAGNDTIYRTIVTLNSKTGEFNQVATLEQYAVIYAGESAIDWTNRILYGILQPQSPDNAPFQLVGVHMSSGKVVTNPQICSDSCPWALEFFNKPWH